MAEHPTPGLDPNARLGVRLTLIVIAFILLAIPFGVLLLEVVFKGPLVGLDQRIAIRQNQADLRDEDRVTVARAVTFLGSTPVLIGVVIIACVWLAVLHRRRRQALFLLTTSVLGVVVNNIIKALVARSRPQFDHAVAHAFGKSFPSGHAMNSTVVYGSLLVIAWGPLHTAARRAIAFVLVASLIGAIATSRVVLGVHYASDVVAGMALGSAFVLSSAAAFNAWQHEGGRLPAAVADAPTLPSTASNG
jgi:undecaprenyl-diphosphatase